jgi:hypothetical protein
VAVDLFAGIPLGDYKTSIRLIRSDCWAQRPSFVPNATEAVWELAEHLWVFIEERPEMPTLPLPTVGYGGRMLEDGDEVEPNEQDRSG